MFIKINTTDYINLELISGFGIDRKGSCWLALSSGKMLTAEYDIYSIIKDSLKLEA